MADFGASEEELKATGQKRGQYINSGMLVMNLSLWRLENVSEKCLKLSAAEYTGFSWEDQSALNSVAVNRILHLDKRYNFFARATDHSLSYLQDARPAVIHFLGVKPWRGECLLRSVWKFYAEDLDEILPVRAIGSVQNERSDFRRFLSRFNKSRKILFGELFGKDKYVERRKVMDYLNNILPERCIKHAHRRNPAA